MITEHRKAPNQRLLRRTLAEEVTKRVHSKSDLEKAIKASSILFGKAATEDLKSLDEKTLMQVFEGVPQIEVSKTALGVTDAATFFSATTNNLIFKSKGQPRIEQGQLRIEQG